MAAKAPSTRPALTRERVLTAALELADESGLDALSMRSLGRRLGVEAMSLYHHVANKEDVVSGIVDRVWGMITISRDETDWREAVRRTARSAFVTMLGHPWAARARTQGGPARMGYIDASLGYLRTAGFSAEDTYHAHHVIEAYILGYVLQVLDTRGSGDEAEQARAIAMFRSIDTASIPHLTEHFMLHQGEQGSGFDFGLDLILDGLERTGVRDRAAAED